MRTITTLFLLVIALPASAFQWEYLGMDGIAATTLTVDSEHERVYVGTYEGFWFFNQATSQWIERDDEGWIGRTVWAVDYHDDLSDRVITGRENAWFKGYMEYSDDLGETESVVYESTGGRVTDVMHDHGYHYACTWSDVAPGEFLRSEDGGESWEPLAGHGFYAMTDMDFSLEGAIYLSGDAGLKASWNFGLNWDDLTGDLPAGYGIYCVAGAYPGGDVIPWPCAFVSNDLGIYYSDHPGLWTQKSSTSCRRIINIPGQFMLSGDDLAAVSWDGRVIHSTSFGDNWNDETGDLPGTPIDVAFSANGFDLYVLTSTRGLYRYSDLETSVDPPPAALVTLSAYPNPFNPKTTLGFSLPAAGSARLEIFDASGRRVAKIFDEPRPAGKQSADWNAEALPSGVYFASLVSGEFEASTGLVLLK